MEVARKHRLSFYQNIQRGNGLAFGNRRDQWFQIADLQADELRRIGGDERLDGLRRGQRDTAGFAAEDIGRPDDLAGRSI